MPKKLQLEKLDKTVLQLPKTTYDEVGLIPNLNKCLEAKDKNLQQKLKLRLQWQRLPAVLRMATVLGEKKPV